MIKAIAIDDEPIATKVIELFCSDLDFISLEKSFNKAPDALDYLEQYPADLLFLDIDMPELNGIELYKRIEQDTMVIFTTVHLEYAVEGFNLNAIDYLVKPYTEERFLQAVNKAKEYFQVRNSSNTENKFLFVRADYSLIKINLASILLIEGLDDYLKIHLHEQKPVVARMTMKSVLEKLPPKEFVRLHRSFIAPINKIEQVRSKVVKVAGREITLGTSYEKDFMKVFGGEPS